MNIITIEKQQEASLKYVVRALLRKRKDYGFLIRSGNKIKSINNLHLLLKEEKITNILKSMGIGFVVRKNKAFYNSFNNCGMGFNAEKPGIIDLSNEYPEEKGHHVIGIPFHKIRTIVIKLDGEHKEFYQIWRIYDDLLVKD